MRIASRAGLERLRREKVAEAGHVVRERRRVFAEPRAEKRIRCCCGVCVAADEIVSRAGAGVAAVVVAGRRVGVGSGRPAS